MFKNSVSALREACRLLKPVPKRQVINIEQKRTTAVVERIYRLPITSKNRPPRIYRRHEIYRLITVEGNRPSGNIVCILTEDIDEVGSKNTLVEIPRKNFRNKYYPLQMAVYDTPENRLEYGIPEDAVPVTNVVTTFRKTVDRLKMLHLRVPMNGEVPWTLSPFHIRVAMRKMGIESDESCITMPEEPISAPQEFTFKLTVNKTETVDIKATVYHRGNAPKLPPRWIPYKQMKILESQA